MKVFITGGTGFLGGQVVEELKKRGHHLLLLSRTDRGKRGEGPSFVRGDFSNSDQWKNKVKSFKPDIGIHFAWEKIPNADFDVCMNNLVGGLNCLRAMGEAGCKTVLMAGSDQEYGHSGKIANEQLPPKPYNLLYSTKVAQYYLASKIAEQYQINLIWTRIFFMYGPGQRSGALIPYLTSSLTANVEPEIRNPHGANDFIHVEDVARAIRMLIEHKPKSKNEIYNIGSGKLIPTKEIIKNVYAFFKKPLPNFSNKKFNTWVGAYADIKKIKEDIGWEPKVSLEEGIKKTIKELLKK